jgi:hypothetical protein
MASVRVKERDLGWGRILDDLKDLKRAKTKVGYYGDGSGDPETNIAARAAIHVFGSRDGTIPRRDFMGYAFDTGKKQIEKQVRILVGRLYQTKGRASVRNLVATLGEFHVGQIKEAIARGPWEPLAPSTIRQKGSSQPLIDTGEMRNSVTHKETIR